MNKTIHHHKEIDNQYADCYIAYTRKSTDDADNQKNSIEYQEEQIRLSLAGQGIQLAPISIEGFCTDGVITEHHSGFKEDADFETNPDGTISISVERPKFLMLVNLLRQKKFKGVISLCWDRFSRNEADDMLTKKLLKQGIDVRFVQVKYDTGSSGALHMDIDGMFSRHYSRTISEKVRNTNKKLRSEGKCIYTPPLGYISTGSDNKPFDPERAPLVKRIFELYATGEWSFITLAQWANKHGLTTKPCRRKRTREEKLQGIQLQDIPKTTRPITEKTIWHILNNSFYIGKIRHKDELLDSKAHLPLIDLATFYKVQATLKQKAVKVYYPEMEFFTYRGLIKCGTCGRAYSPYAQKGIAYYRSVCKPECTNSVKNINDNFITKKIMEVFSRIHFTEDERRTIEASARKNLDKLTGNRNKQITDIQFQKNKIVENMAYLAKDKLNLLRIGVFTPLQIIEEEGRLKAQLKEYEEKISSFSASAQSMLDYVISFSELVKHASVYYPYALDTEKRELVIQVFSELYIDNGELKYHANKGFDALLKRFEPLTMATCGQDYVILELEQIYHSVRSSKSFLEQYIKYSIQPRAG
ncbi:MAG: recombinase family protein [Taibaiella sp.]|nr:recombinase family protein [Taibaiella sp.]